MRIPSWRRIRKIEAVVGWTGLLVWMYNWATWSSYISLPRSPDQITGRLYPLNIHGIVVYLTHAEHDRLFIVGCVGAALGICAILLDVMDRRVNSAKPSTSI
jgi:hypothetical protein